MTKNDAINPDFARENPNWRATGPTEQAQHEATEQAPVRQAEPHEDDVCVQRIEIEFAIPVYIPPGALRELDGLLSSVVRMKMNQLEGHAHWVSGYGSKPMWSQADARFLGKTPADDAPASGEPRFDDTVYHVETSCIERTPPKLPRPDVPPVKRSPHDPEGQ